ncbi:MAG: arsenite methyltransferase [Planctomycetota bacterium]|jgi:ubiquinone/menaquinone biosynthesis C-methylase UbiE
MSEDNVKHEIVRNAYAKRAKLQSSCCEPAPCCCGEAAKSQPIPEAEMGLSCGNPISFSELKPGDIVVDLGSGGGRDVFPAASIVGETGKVIGVDMTEEMIDLANRNADTFRKKTGLDNVEFRFGKIEDTPIEDNSVDVVISNCVINLSPDKPQVFREIFRILKPGGSMVVSDIVLNRELPAWAKNDDGLYASCIAGALLKEDYISAAKQAGFGKIDIRSETEYGYGSGRDPITAEQGKNLEGCASSITLVAIK